MTEYLIQSENSSDHWPFLDVENENVLDIGCGIWYTDNMEETSPVYFSKKANLVIGCDSNNDDIIKYREYCKDTPNLVFYHINIQNADQVRQSIQQHAITVLKCDIEGFEIALKDLTVEDLSTVKKIAIEFHTQELKELFLQKIPEWGFEIILTASFKQTPPNLGVLYGIKK